MGFIFFVLFWNGLFRQGFATVRAGDAGIRNLVQDIFQLGVDQVEQGTLKVWLGGVGLTGVVDQVDDIRAVDDVVLIHTDPPFEVYWFDYTTTPKIKKAPEQPKLLGVDSFG